MLYCTFLIVFGLAARCVHCFWPPAYKVDLSDRKVFVIASDEADYKEEEEEDEMIRAEDLAEFGSLADDEERFKPLHSHVERYNKRSARTATEFAELFPESFEPSLEDIRRLVEEAKPFVAGFKHELDEYDFDDLEERVFKAVRKKRNNLEKSNATEASSTIDTSAKLIPTTENSGEGERVRTIDEESDRVTKNEKATTEMRETETERSKYDETAAEEEYDYEQFKAEYYEQIESLKNDTKTFNYTDNGAPEETAKDAIVKIVDFKMPRNCTREELTQFGAKALECLAQDYKNAKTEKNVGKILSRTWLVVRIWICVYLCIAIPCWCQKGWCCCCFNCAVCKPEDTILEAKKYYAENPPGVLVEYENRESKTTEFEPTLFELEAYEGLESAIRNL